MARKSDRKVVEGFGEAGNPGERSPQTLGGFDVPVTSKEGAWSVLTIDANRDP